MVWTPVNLTTTCPADNHLTSCTPFGFTYLSLLVQLYGGSIESEPQPDPTYESNPYGQYDFIVVGAGAAGCVVANRLTENPRWNVLVLEAGPEQPKVTIAPSFSSTLIGSSIDWKYVTEPDGRSCLARPGGRCDWPRGKMMGGSSSINSMAYIRGNKVDYDDWYKLGNPGWSYEEVLPFFKKSERNLNQEIDMKYHGVNGEQSVSKYPYIDKPSYMLTDAFHERGLPLNDYNAAEQEVTMQAQATSQNGERVSTNSAFIKPIQYKRSNLIVKTNSEVVKILIDGQKRAYGVIYQHENKFHTVYAKKEVIISAGAINSPKLLMLSGIGPKEHLESLGIPEVQDLPVGHNLQDHITFNDIVIALPNGTATNVGQDEVLDRVKEYADMQIKNGPIASNGPVNSIAFLRTEKNLVAPDIQYQFNHVQSWREYISDPILYEKLAIFPTAFYDAVIPRTMNLVPKSKGCVALNPADPNGAPIIYANYFADETDMLPLLKGVKFLLSLEDTTAFKSLGAYFVREQLPACKDYEWGTDDYIICLAKSYTSSTYHPVGTCKMGPRWDTSAVVNNELQVYGIQGLRVIDASIMPIIVRGNTNAPSIMIGERGVDFVIKFWKCSYYK